MLKSRKLGSALIAMGFIACGSNNKSSSPNHPGGGAPGAGGGGAVGGSGASGGSSGKGGGGVAGTGGKLGAGGSRFVPESCGLPQPAFCEDFENPHPGGRGGDINEAEWSFARHAHMRTGFLKRAPATSAGSWANTPTFCNAPFSGIFPPGDVRICDGTDGGGFISKQLNEVFHDYEDFAINSMRIRQPFDFAGGKGTIVFDVDAKINDGFAGHGWWNEFWITEDPAPVPYHVAPSVGSLPRNGFGIQMVPRNPPCERSGYNEIGNYFVVQNYRVVREELFMGQCFRSSDTKLNRFKIVISTNDVEVWVTNSDTPSAPAVKVATATGLNLNFTRGYVHFQHSQYNAPKDGNASPSQTFRWDNIAFDGPSFPRPRGYDIPDELQNFSDASTTGKSFGYYLGILNEALTPKTFRFQGVDLTDAVSATFNFSLFAAAGERLRYRFNGNAWHEFEVPSQLVNPGDALLRALSTPVPVSELKAGENVLETTLAAEARLHAVIGNIDLTVQPSR
ncbi:MAG TPA: hypothetical protein VI072_01950 [Polyangiaceae bacterium]